MESSSPGSAETAPRRPRFFQSGLSPPATTSDEGHGEKAEHSGAWLGDIGHDGDVIDVEVDSVGDEPVAERNLVKSISRK